MAHQRLRHLEGLTRKLLGYSPIVGILGHRQAGKTTMLGQLASDYLTMDHRATMQAATADPDRFIAGFSKLRTGLDECQLVPELFPALKERVRVDKRPGQFILTGSVRFTSRKAIRESLTGRIITVNLHPLMLTEILEMDSPQIARALLFKGVQGAEQQLSKSATASNKIKAAVKVLGSYGKLGGLPGICFIRDAAIRAQKLETQIETILDRDLRQVFDTKVSYSTVRRVLMALALRNCQPLEISELARLTRVSAPTLRRLLSAFESLFLINFIPAEGNEKRPSILFEDPGEAYFLADGRIDDLTEWSSTVLTQLRAIFDLPLSGNDSFICKFSQYRTRGGAFIPLVIRSGNFTLGVIPMIDESPNLQILGSSKSFLNANPNATVVCVHPHSKIQTLSKGLIALPGVHLLT